MKKMNNKGFSLVELIIVIAIMAVLMGVLAPQFIKYVESSRVQKDLSAVAEVQNAAQIALSVDEVYSSVASGTTVEVKNNSKVTSSNTALQAEIQKAIPDTIMLSSKAYGSKTATITLTFDSSTGTFSLTTSWSGAAGGAGGAGTP